MGESLQAIREDVVQLQRSVFGFIDPDTNAFVPGVMQLAADTAKELRQIKWVLVFLGLLAIGTRPDLLSLAEKLLPR